MFSPKCAERISPTVSWAPNRMNRMQNINFVSTNNDANGCECSAWNLARPGQLPSHRSTDRSQVERVCRCNCSDASQPHTVCTLHTLVAHAAVAHYLFSLSATDSEHIQCRIPQRKQRECTQLILYKQKSDYSNVENFRFSCGISNAIAWSRNSCDGNRALATVGIRLKNTDSVASIVMLCKWSQFGTWKYILAHAADTEHRTFIAQFARDKSTAKRNWLNI